MTLYGRSLTLVDLQSCLWSAKQGKNEFSPVPVRAFEFGLARRVQPSRPASPRSFSTLRLNLVRTHGPSLSSRFPPPCGIDTGKSPSGESLAKIRSNGITTKSSPAEGHWSHGSSSGIGVAFPGNTIDQLMCASPFLHPLLVQWACGYM